MMRHFTALTLVFCAGAVSAQTRIEVSDLTALPPAEVVVLGEIHDNPTHHENQAEAVSVIGPAAVVYEMLTPAQAEAFDPALLDDAEALEAALGWADSGWPDFEMYYPIFAAAPGAAVYGANVPREDLRAAFDAGAAAAFGAEAERYGLTRPLPEDQQATREAAQLSAHCDALPAELLPGMVAAQRVRDAALARAVVQAVDAHGTPVVVITGNGHARRDWAVPHKLGLAAPDLDVLSVGQLEDAPASGDWPPYDLFLVTAPAAREDPCAAFR